MFDKVVCLVLDKRIKDWPDTREACLKHGLDVEPFFCGNGKDLTQSLYDHIDIVPPERPKSSYKAFRDRPNSFNAFLSFKKIIQRAVDHNKSVEEWAVSKNRSPVAPKFIEKLLLLEDDILIKDNFAPLLSFARQQLEQFPGWEFFYLGCNLKTTRKELVAPNLYRVNGAGCFHAVCLRNTVFQKVLDLDIINPIDGEVARLLHNRGQAYAINTCIVTTKDGFSYCEGRNVSYEGDGCFE